jgi:glycosyltransferase involved in cell wall biosynthesis
MGGVVEMSILVSISCLTYNHENYIKDAIEGFLMQKGNFDIEVLIHDDASTDNTTEIIKEYQNKYPDIIKPFMQAENQLSKGVKRLGNRYNNTRAKGKYIALCEGDDYWTDPNKLQKQIDFMENNKEYSMCYHTAAVVDVEKNSLNKLIKPFNDDGEVPIEVFILRGGGSFQTASVMYRKELMDNPPKWYFESPVGDVPQALILATKGKIMFLDETMSAYRKGAEVSWTERVYKNKEKCKDYLISRIKMLDYFNESTNFKYGNEIDKAKLNNELKILEIECDWKGIKSQKYRNTLKEMGVIGEIKLFIKIKFPSIYNNMKLFKSNLKKLMSKFS